MAACTDEKLLFRMYRSNSTGFFHVVFKDLDAAYRIYAILRINVAESELPHINYIGGKKQAICIKGDDGKREWGAYVLPYIYRQSEEDTEFFFVVRNGKLVARDDEQNIL